MLEGVNITVRYGGRRAVDGLSFQLKEHDWLMLAGPNGAGKSTLVRAVSQCVPYEGKILLGGRDLKSFRPGELALRIGVLSQQHSVTYGYTVNEIVRLGRYAHEKGFLSRRDEGGETSVKRALELTGMTEFKNARMPELSGGEQQRAFLAQVFAQDPEILLLDEPANHLDLKYQQQIFDLIADWISAPGHAAVSVVHDLSLARRYGTRGILMHEGRCAAEGDIDNIFAPEILRGVYQMDVDAWMRGLLSQWQ